MKVRKLFTVVVPLLLGLAGMVTLLLAMSVSSVWAEPPSFERLSSTTCVTLQPDNTAGKDAYIKEDKPNENKGDGNDLKVKTESGHLNRALLQFDLSSLPAGATINSATLSLYVSKANGGSVTINAHQVTASWNEDEVTWNNREAGSTWGTAGGDYGAVVASTNVDDTENVWRSWDITSLVTDWVSGTVSNFGVVLEAAVTNPKAEKKFKSSDHGTASERPKLEVCYSTSTPPPSPGGEPTVDGRLDSSYSYLKHFDKVDTGDPKTALAPGNLYGYEGTDACYWAFVVDRAFNDNVYAPKAKDGGTPDDAAYLLADGWTVDHDFKALHKSDHAKFGIIGSSGTFSITLDLLNEVTLGSVYTSGLTGKDKSDLATTPDNQYVDGAATSLFWNVYNSNWGDFTNRSPAFDYNSTSGEYWEWNIIYEYSILKSDLASIGISSGCGDVTQSGAHNSPSKDDETLGKIGDYVWHDANDNGLQDDGGASAGIANVTVNLYVEGGSTPIRTTQTAPSGYYIFNNLQAGNYYVEFELPPSYVFTSQNAGGDDALDSDADPATGKTGIITLAAGQTDLTWDAGLHACLIGDRVWHDQNGDGLQTDPGPIFNDDEGFNDVEVYLYADAGITPTCGITTGWLAMTTTISGTSQTPAGRSDGIYGFDMGALGLGTGAYWVCVDESTLPDLGTGNHWTSTTGGNAQQVSYAAGVDDFSFDFGYEQEADPTAVTLSSFSASSSAGGSVNPLWLGLTVLAAGGLFWVKRRAGG